MRIITPAEKPSVAQSTLGLNFFTNMIITAPKPVAIPAHRVSNNAAMKFPSNI
jgi:hypothetical protein